MLVPELGSVHPRAGGELASAEAHSLPTIGSSPRGRGTLRRQHRQDLVLRFIPARAGNSSSADVIQVTPPVHPRAGGELGSPAPSASAAAGSSPRGRGTHPYHRRRRRRDRFIPARAGNSPPGTSPRHRWTVHPRAGGELKQSAVRRSASAGSSPRGRGTRVDVQPHPLFDRFIPARAGNSLLRARAPAGATVHPRAGGELAVPIVFGNFGCGSSPRGRGTLLLALKNPVLFRFIPARAGNSLLGQPAGPGWPVHPRAGGELPCGPPIHQHRTGSSPRGRGTQLPATMSGLLRRFIPARAGNSDARRNVRSREAVHPRAGGELPRTSECRRYQDGSSPRGRGTPALEAGDLERCRFIPARAGNSSGSAG